MRIVIFYSFTFLLLVIILWNPFLLLVFTFVHSLDIYLMHKLFEYYEVSNILQLYITYVYYSQSPCFTRNAHPAQRFALFGTHYIRNIIYNIIDKRYWFVYNFIDSCCFSLILVMWTDFFWVWKIIGFWDPWRKFYLLPKVFNCGRVNSIFLRFG